MAGILAVLVLAAVGCRAAEPTVAPPRVLIFHAPWCSACPSEQEITRLMVDFPNVEVCPINVDENPEIVREYGVTKIPFIILCDAQGCRITNNIEELRCWLVERPSL